MQVKLPTIKVLCAVLICLTAIGCGESAKDASGALRGKSNSTTSAQRPTTITMGETVKPTDRPASVRESRNLPPKSGPEENRRLRPATSTALPVPSVKNGTTSVISNESEHPDSVRKDSWVQQIAYVAGPEVPSETALKSLSIEETKMLEKQSGDFENLSWASQVITKSMWRFYPRSRNNPACTYHGQLYREHFINMTQWAVKMFDSSDITPNGILETDYFNSGHFDECLTIDVKALDVQGQYCLVTAEYRPREDLSSEFYAPDKETNYYQPDPMKSVWLDAKPHTDVMRKNRSMFEFAVCLPKSCSAEDLQIALQETVDQVASAHKLYFKLSVSPNDCSIRDSEIRDPVGFTMTLLILLGAAIMVVIATALDVMVFRERKSNGLLRTLLIPFSAAGNIERLQKPTKDVDFASMNMSKALVMLMVIGAHRLIVVGGGRISNLSWNEKIARMPMSAYYNGGCSVVVDIFFVISGFLAYLFIFRTLQLKKKVNFILFFLYRWLRIVPVYALVLAIYTFVLPNLSDGPLWNRFVEREVTNCKNNWWLNLLFINNYVHSNKQCMIQSWYLAVDTQLFVLNLLLASFVYRHRQHAKLIFSSVIGLAMAIPAFQIYYGRYDAAPLAHQRFVQDVYGDRNFSDMYIKVHARAVPYILGMATAHLYMKLKDIKFKFTKAQMWMGFTFGAIIANVAILYSAVFLIPGRPYYVVEHMIYNPVHRFLFALFPCFVLLGQGTTGFGILSRFAASTFFGVLGRLSFCCYLIHPIVQLTIFSAQRTGTHINFYNLFWGLFGDYFTGFLLALVLNLLFESPVDRFQKKIFRTLIQQYEGARKATEHAAGAEIEERRGKNLPPTLES